jgi:opacity protein-like surface antigen
MKKLLLVAALSVATTSVFAQAKNFEGPSAALTIGAVGADTQYNENDVAYDSTAKLNSGKTSLVSGLDLSYAKAVDANWLIGFGITYDFTKTKSGEFSSTEGAESASLSISGKNHYSIYVQPTYALNDSTALFVKLGYHSLKGVIEGTWTDGVDSESGSQTAKFKGIGYGFGVKTFINKNLYIQAEAQIVDYKKKTFTEEDYSESYKVKSNAGIISVGYKF